MRPDLDLVASWIAPGSRVLDLGCGDGALLAHLTAKRQCTGTGVEIDESALLQAVRSGVPVWAVDVDSELHLFGDDSYDVVVLSQTLQQTRRPDEVLQHLARIAPLSILAVPNFAYWRHRAVLALRGRMPMSPELPYPWYRTPNIHLSTLPDIEDLLAATGLVVQRRVPLDVEHRAQPGMRAANLLAAGAVYLVQRAQVTCA